MSKNRKARDHDERPRRGRGPLPQHTCQVCGAEFTHVAALDAHVTSEHGGGQPGDAPGQGYTSGQSITRGATAANPDAGSLEDDQPGESVPRFVCDACGSVFRSADERDAHDAEQHRTPAAERALAEERLPAELGGPAQPYGNPLAASAGAASEDQSGVQDGGHAGRRKTRRRRGRGKAGTEPRTPRGRTRRDAGTGVGSGGGAGGRGVT